MMDRTVLRVICTTDQAELVADQLLQSGASAVAEEAVVAEAGPGGEEPRPYHARGGTVALTGDVHTDLFVGFRAWLGQLSPPPTLQFPEVDPLWADEWRKHAEAVVAGPFLVRPPWVEADSLNPDPTGGETVRSGPLGVDRDRPRPTELVVDPGHAFGSGSHPTTRMCLEAIGDLVARPPDGGYAGGCPPPTVSRTHPVRTVADVGCGSGILAVGALLAGAESAVGVDIDPVAGDASRSVALANGVGERYEFRPGGIGALCARREVFDVVLANLLIPVIEELGGDLRAICAPGGVVVLSGLLVEHRTRALVALGATDVLGEYRNEGWLTLVVQRESWVSGSDEN